jgi:hypothetical protein
MTDPAVPPWPERPPAGPPLQAIPAPAATTAATADATTTTTTTAATTTSPPAGAPPSWMGADPDRVPRWGLWDVVAGLFLWLLVSTVVSVAVYLPTGDAGLANVVGQLSGLATMLGWPLFVTARKGSGAVVDLGLRFRPVDLLTGLVFAAGTLLVAGTVNQLLSLLLEAESASNTEQIYGQGDARWTQVAIVVLAVVGAPFVEEVFFRGLVLRAMAKRWGTGAAIVGSAVLFAVLHWLAVPRIGLDIVPFLGTLVVYGLVLGALAVWQQRLGPGIVLHATLNGLATLVYFVGPPAAFLHP